METEGETILQSASNVSQRILAFRRCVSISTETLDRSSTYFVRLCTHSIGETGNNTVIQPVPA